MATTGGSAEAKKSLSPPAETRRASGGGKHVQVAGERTEVLEVTEKHGTLYNAIPCMPLPVAILCCVFNIIVPGLGTFISAWTALCGCKTRLGAPAKAFGLNLLSAFLQMITFVIIVGWVWSIIWGMNFVQISRPTPPDILDEEETGTAYRSKVLGIRVSSVEKNVVVDEE